MSREKYGQDNINTVKTQEALKEVIRSVSIDITASAARLTMQKYDIVQLFF